MGGFVLMVPGAGGRKDGIVCCCQGGEDEENGGEGGVRERWHFCGGQRGGRS